MVQGAPGRALESGRRCFRLLRCCRLPAGRLLLRRCLVWRRPKRTQVFSFLNICTHLPAALKLIPALYEKAQAPE